MELVDIRDLFHHQEDYVGKKITVGGWVRSKSYCQRALHYCSKRNAWPYRSACQKEKRLYGKVKRKSW